MLQAFVLMLLYPSALEVDSASGSGWYLDQSDEKTVNLMFGSVSAALFTSVNMLFFGVSDRTAVEL